MATEPNSLQFWLIFTADFLFNWNYRFMGWYQKSFCWIQTNWLMFLRLLYFRIRLESCWKGVNWFLIYTYRLNWFCHWFFFTFKLLPLIWKISKFC